MKIILIGDIYGKTGRDALGRLLPELVKRFGPHWIIANGENTTAGNGLSAKHALLIKKCGVDIITTGNHIFARLDWPEVLQKHDFILRPQNLGVKDAPGSGCRIFSKDGLPDLAVMNIAGRVFMEEAECPFATFDRLYASLPKGVRVVVDFHAEATSEKLAFFWYVNGRASVVVGTHTHVQTSDERVLPGGKTVALTDLGMSGACDGIIGVDRDTITGRFTKGYSDKFLCAPGPGKLEGFFAHIDDDGQIAAYERFRLIEQQEISSAKNGPITP